MEGGAVSYDDTIDLPPELYSITGRTGAGFTLTIDESALSYEGAEGEAMYYSILVTYRTDVTANQPSWRNDASFNQGGAVYAIVTRPASTYGNVDPLMNKYVEDLDPDDRLIRWAVYLSPVGSTLREVSINDAFYVEAAASMTLLVDGAHPLKVTLGTKPLTEGAETFGYTVTDDGTDGFTVTLTDDVVIKGERLILNYYTRYDMGPANAYGQYNDGQPITYGNYAGASAKKDGANDAEPIEPAYGSVDLNPRQYMNAAKSGSYANGRFSWIVTFNYNKADITGEVTITDRWGTVSDRQQEMDLGSLTVTNADVVAGPFLRDDGKGFSLTLGNIGSQVVTVKYVTYRVGTPVTEYSNHVRIGDGPEIKASVINLNAALLNKGAALGAGNSILWTVVVNQAAYDLAGAEVVDVLGKGQTYDESSLVISRCNANGLPSGLPLTPGPEGDYTVDASHNPVDDATTVIISFNESYAFNTPHRLTYRSTVDDDTIERNEGGIYQVDNKVSLSGGRIVTQASTVRKENHWTIISGNGSGAKEPVYVEKLDAGTGVGLMGAEFRLTDASGDHEFMAGIVTDGDGLAFVANLSAGTYRLYEVSPPPGYLACDPGYKDFVVESKDALGLTITFRNEKEPPAVESGTPEPSDPGGGNGPSGGTPEPSDPGGGGGTPEPSDPGGDGGTGDGGGDGGDGDGGPTNAIHEGGDSGGFINIGGDGPPAAWPGGTDPDVPPVPSLLGHTVVPGDEDGTYYELDEDGVPYAVWRWDDGPGMWVLDELPLPGALPHTGDVDPMTVYWLAVAGMGLIGIAFFLSRHAMARHKTSKLRTVPDEPKPDGEGEG